VVTLVGLFQSRGWLAGLGAVFVCASIITVVYARSQRLRVGGASVEIEGISIDSLNAANLRRRVSKNFFVQSVHHIVTIEGSDLEIIWQYAGYCRSDSATSFEFSVDSEHSIPFSRLDCFGYDLKCDPERQHRIQPLLIGPDSISKKLAVPFLKPLIALPTFRHHAPLPPAQYLQGRTGLLQLDAIFQPAYRKPKQRSFDLSGAEARMGSRL
jgi:hypothetical protein